MNGKLIALALLGLVASCKEPVPVDRTHLPPSTDGVSHTSGKKGKWVKGCPPQPCNLGVGNLGPANTYHWVEE